MSDPTPGGDETLRRERDLYKHLLDVGVREESKRPNFRAHARQGLNLLMAFGLDGKAS